MMSIPSDQLRPLTDSELDRFGLAGEDPAWEEYVDAEQIKTYGPLRWPFIKRCVEPSGDLAGCVRKVYEQYPDK
jgi:hypothetical protein